MDRRLIGQRAEERAATFLREHGCEVVLRNFRRRCGELDIVARERGVLVVAEVRLRSREDYGGAAASIDAHKRTRIVRTTQLLLQRHREFARLPVRFDVLVVHEDREPAVEWIRHAFEA